MANFARLTNIPAPRWTDSNGKPCAGWWLRWKDSETSDLADVWADAFGMVPQQNPTHLNADGTPPNGGEIFGEIGKLYDLEVLNPSGAVMWTARNIFPGHSSASILLEPRSVYGNVSETKRIGESVPIVNAVENNPDSIPTSKAVYDLQTALQANIDSEAGRATQAETNLQSNINIINALLNTEVQTDTRIAADESTVYVETGYINLKTGTASDDSIPMPIVSEVQAGVLNPAIYKSLLNVISDVDNILGQSWLVMANLGTAASPADANGAWLAQTGQQPRDGNTVINLSHNNELWKFGNYQGVEQWVLVANSFDLTAFTNTMLGGIRGSLQKYQIFAEPDGTGSVNGLDLLESIVNANASNIANLQNAFSAHSADNTRHITAGERADWNSRATAADVASVANNLSNHVANRSNPHGVTYSQLPDKPAIPAPTNMPWQNANGGRGNFDGSSKWQRVWRVAIRNGVIDDDIYFFVVNGDYSIKASFLISMRKDFRTTNNWGALFFDIMASNVRSLAETVRFTSDGTYIYFELSQTYGGAAVWANFGTLLNETTTAAPSIAWTVQGVTGNGTNGNYQTGTLLMRDPRGNASQYIRGDGAAQNIAPVVNNPNAENLARKMFDNGNLVSEDMDFLLGGTSNFGKTSIVNFDQTCRFAFKGFQDQQIPVRQGNGDVYGMKRADSLFGWDNNGNAACFTAESIDVAGNSATITKKTNQIRFVNSTSIIYLYVNDYLYNTGDAIDVRVDIAHHNNNNYQFIATGYDSSNSSYSICNFQLQNNILGASHLIKICKGKNGLRYFGRWQIENV